MLGVRRWKHARQQAVLLVALAVLLNVWWLAFLVTDGVHNIIRWR